MEQENHGTMTIRDNRTPKNKNSITITIKPYLETWRVYNSIDNNYASFPFNQDKLAWNYALGMKTMAHKLSTVQAVYIDKFEK